MRLENEKVTVQGSPAVTGEGQSTSQKANHSITENQPACNDDFSAEVNVEVLLDRMNSPDYLHTVTLTELYDTAYQPRAQIVDDFLSAGVYLFVGAPKVGKSFFMAQLGYHVGAGLPLWDFPTHKGKVLYLALEDSYARLQKRLSRMFGTDSIDGFYLATQAKNLKEGLDGQLKRFVSENPDTNLIIIDTLQKIREVGGEKYSYASDYEIVAHLKKIADYYNICILLVHHTRKQSADDCFDTISGTNGLLGASDGAFVMQKEKRTENRAILDVTGRDQQDQRLHVQLDKDSFVWKLIKKETELWKEPPDPLLEKIAYLLTEETPEWTGSASDLMERLDGMDIQPNVLTRKLNVAADRLWNEYGIRIEPGRKHAGRIIKLTLEQKEA